MSNEAINWALSTPIKHSTAKFVLVVMANCADQDRIAWPSVAHLTESTGQDRKTVLENIKRLVVMGYIEDTGKRKGITKQVIVYRLKDTENGTVNDADSSKATEGKQAQKRNHSENGTVPKFPANSTVFPAEQSQISAETGPKTGHGTIKEPSSESSGKQKKREQSAPKETTSFDVLLESGVDESTAKDWLKHRKAKRASDSRSVIDDRIEQAGIAGITLTQALRMEMSRGWQGFNAAWLQNQARASPGRQIATPADLAETNRQAKELLFGKPKEYIDV
jgi:hypothetical protein